MSGYPPIPRDPSGAPLPVVWDDGLQSWKVYEGLMPLETKLAAIESKLLALDSKFADGSAKVALSGTIPEITTIIDAVAVTEANAFVDDAGTLIPGTLIDKYVDWDLFVINTHDSAFRCSFMPVDLFNSTPSLVMRDGSVKNYSTGTIPGATAQHLIPAESYPIALGTIPAKAGDVEAVDTHPYKNYAGDLRLYLRSVNAPTKGSITVKLVGRLR
jgi:hypothetical protein